MANVHSKIKAKTPQQVVTSAIGRANANTLAGKRPPETKLVGSENTRKSQKLPAGTDSEIISNFPARGLITSTINSPTSRLQTMGRFDPAPGRELPKKKKRVRFSDFSTMHILHLRDSSYEIYYSSKERAKFKLDTVLMANLIRDGLSVNPAMLDDYPEEVVGLEELIKGVEHVQKMQLRKKKIIRKVVLASRLLREEMSNPEVSGVRLSEETIVKQIAVLYEKACRNSVSNARSRATMSKPAELLT